MWALARHQQDVVSREQLLGLDFSSKAIKHQMESGVLHPLWPGVYTVGTPNVTRQALLDGRGALLRRGRGHTPSDGGLAPWDLEHARRHIHVSVPAYRNPSGKGIVVHRRAAFEATKYRSIPVTTPVCTVVDLAAAPHPRRGRTPSSTRQMSGASSTRVPALKGAVDACRAAPAEAKVKYTIDRRTFTFTRSGLERAFKPIALRAGLPQPETCVYVNGYEVDFYFRELGIVVETDGGTFHCTPAQQAKDRRRDHAHTAAGLLPLRFTHGQIRYEPSYVVEILTTVVLGRRARA